MLATKENTLFKKEPSTGDSGQRIGCELKYEYKGEELLCRVSQNISASLAPSDEQMHTDLVEKINQELCKNYPYEELLTLEVIPPNATLNPVKAIAGAVAQAANDLLALQPYNETWPEVEQRFNKEFVEGNMWENPEGDVKFVAIGNIIVFFKNVVERFSSRAYMTGWAEGHKKGMRVNQQDIVKQIEFRMKELEALPQSDDVLGEKTGLQRILSMFTGV